MDAYLTDWLVCYAVSTVLQPFNGEASKVNSGWKG